MSPLSQQLFAHAENGDAFASQVDAILTDNSLCTLATANEDGSPHVNTAYYAHDGQLHLYILTPPSTVHAKNLESRPAVALSVFRSDQGWGSPHRGLQLFGAAAPVGEDEHRRVFDCYSTKHPALLDLAPDAERMLEELESRFYDVQIKSLKIVDEAANGSESLISIHVSRTDRDSGSD